MGTEQRPNGAWEAMREIAERLNSPHADKLYVAKDYTKADLRRDILGAIPQSKLKPAP